jgi:hypothetical protein
MHLNRKRNLLAIFARREAEQKRSGNANMAGPAIEPYLSVFRDALNQNGSTEDFSDLSRGFPWCCAFVYYCCLQAGYHLSPKPIESYRYTLSAVSAWHNWASSQGFFHTVHNTIPEKGDIALFNYVFDGNPLDHIGVVLDVDSEGVLCAEGNNLNRTGIFHRNYSVIEGYVRLPEET